MVFPRPPGNAGVLDPWIAGVVMPTLIIFGLMVIPYIDTNPLAPAITPEAA